jgi:hypothetical protein
MNILTQSRKDAKEIHSDRIYRINRIYKQAEGRRQKRNENVFDAINRINRILV